MIAVCLLISPVEPALKSLETLSSMGFEVSMLSGSFGSAAFGPGVSHCG